MVRFMTTLFVSGLALVVCAGVEDTVWHAQKARAERQMTANASRVRALGATGDLTWFAVPAMSDVMRLADTWPADGELGGVVRSVLAQDEFESCSFQLFSFRDREDVELKVDLPIAHDLRVVKVWFQNGNAWVSYFDDSGLKLVPELLLHDENLIRVETGRTNGNWARVLKNGKAEYKWISGPKELGTAGFDPFDAGFVDALTLQPVRLEKNAFKQFFLTLHPAKDQKPGVYKGRITVSHKGQVLATIPLAVRVLPFQLPLPRAYRDLNRPYLHSCMGAMPNLPRLISSFRGDEEKAKACFRAWLQSTYDHSMFHAPYLDKENAWCVPMLKEIGYPLDPVFGNLMIPWFGLNFGGRMSYAQLMSAKDGAAACGAFYKNLLGHTNILVGHGDEQGAAFVTAHREFFKYFIPDGIRVGCAGHAALLNKGGYAYGYYPMAGEPEDASNRARAWYEIGNNPVGFYASQHTGSENPQFTRRQHGMLGYLNGLEMSYNYEFAIGSFNDRANEIYKPMVIAYANGQGLMETIEYAGFREACDDIRYATLLKMLAAEAASKGSVEAKVEAKKTLMFLAMLPRTTMDLNAYRMEAIEKILRLRQVLGK